MAFWFPNDVASYGGIFKMFPIFFAWMGAFNEAVGGIFLLLGLQKTLLDFNFLYDAGGHIYVANGQRHLEYAARRRLCTG